MSDPEPRRYIECGPVTLITFVGDHQVDETGRVLGFPGPRHGEVARHVGKLFLNKIKVN